MSSEGLVTEPMEVEAGRGDGTGGGGDRGDWLKRRWGDKVYSRRRSKKAKINNTSDVVYCEGVKSKDAAPAGDLASVAECTQVKVSASSAHELPNQVERHGVDRLLCRDRILLSRKTKGENLEIRRKFTNDLETVRGVMRKIGVWSEAFPRNEGVRRDSVSSLQLQVRPDVVSLPLVSSGFAQHLGSMRPLDQLNVAGMGNNFEMCENEMTEKRTPNANPLYGDSEFILANNFRSSENNKNVMKNCGSVLEFRAGSKTFEACCSLLERLLKHQFGHIFDSPVDVKGLGLDDYFMIIKQPMDLGTIRKKLCSNYYKVPREFADDVRLTFRNAMTYNPEGHEVNTIARVLLKIFDERWAAIETEYLRALKLAYSNDVHTPTSARSAPFAPSLLSPFGGRSLSRCQTMNWTPPGRIKALKKPKARDLNKRDMTHAEKQRLAVQLQNLPTEKLDGIIQIIRRKDSSATYQSKEIEVDIDAVDAETLWEIDRFITNHRKKLSKVRRENELSSQFRTGAKVVAPTKNPAMEDTMGAAVDGVPPETIMADKTVPSSMVAPPLIVGNNAQSSSSASSSSDTGSSSSSRSGNESSPDGSDTRRPLA